VASVPLAARLVEVIADRGESAPARYVYGSGCIVVGRTVLTAAHVVAGAQTVQVRDSHKRPPYSATVDPGFVGDANGPGPDLALVEIDDPAVDLPPLSWRGSIGTLRQTSRCAVARSAIHGLPKPRLRLPCVTPWMRSGWSRCCRSWRPGC
jgi:hypothetical protein